MTQSYPLIRVNVQSFRHFREPIEIRLPLDRHHRLLPRVAVLAGGNDVAACRSAAAAERHHMVHRQGAMTDASSAVRADAVGDAALPPLALAELARLGALSSQRPGNVHSADGWEEVLLPVIDRYQARKQTVVVRADAAFALPALCEALERRDVAYAIRLPANQVLERTIEDLLTRPRGRPSYAPLVRYRSFQYQARRGTGLDG